MKSGFSPAESAAWGGFLEAYARLDQAVDADLKKHEGISHVEFEVLLRLRFSPDRRRRIQELGDASLLTRSGTSRLIGRLVKSGLVVRQEALEDGRGAYATLTAEGAALFDGSVERHMALVRELFHSRLSAQEVDTLASIWRKVNDTGAQPPIGSPGAEPSTGR